MVVNLLLPWILWLMVKNWQPGLCSCHQDIVFVSNNNIEIHCVALLVHIYISTVWPSKIVYLLLGFEIFFDLKHVAFGSSLYLDFKVTKKDFIKIKA